MATKIAYTSRDFFTILTDIRENLKAATDTLPNVNDFIESNVGRFLLDQWAAIAEMSHFTLDRQAAETYIDTLEQRPNLISLLKVIGFQPKNPSTESVNVTFTRANSITTSRIIIPRKAVLSATSADSGAKIYFSTTAQANINVGSTSTTVAAVQGRWASFTAEASGSPYFITLIPSTKVANEQVDVSVDGVNWSKSTDNTFVGHSRRDMVYRVVNTSDYRVIVEFGNGVEGAVPPKGAKIIFSYLETEGANGHINTGSIISTLIPFGVSVNNEAPSSGGADFETLEVARRRYPELFRTMRRAVTLSDWEALAAKVDGVIQAQAVDINTDTSLPHFHVRLYVVGTNGPSDSLNLKVKEALSLCRVNATIFDVTSPNIINISVAGALNVYRTHDAATVKTNVESAINNFFVMSSSPTSELRIGKPVAVSRLIATILTVQGVASVNLTSPIGDINVPFGSYPNLNTGAINIQIGSII